MTQTKEQLLEQLERLKRNHKQIVESINDTKEKLVEFCPVKIGDTVACNGYSHSGKNIIVDEIRHSPAKYFREEPTEYICKGWILKADGTLSTYHRGEYRV